MYDKSKKTWSQRLKITKTEKSSFSSTASVTTSSSSVAANIGGVVSKQQHQQKYYQQTAAQHNHHQHPQYHHFTVGKSSQYPSAMHLPSALQFSVGVGYATDYMSPATSSSRSMKYADPWIYSTVRGIPARPYHHLFQQQTVATPNYPTHPHAAAIFATPTQLSQHTEALAVVICSCPEYLNGTKRDLKKASVCKKCKGSRLPLTTIGSVVPATKLRANAKAAIAGSPAVAAAAAAATMRIISMTKKSRPTILDPQKDPYDLMRRTRLLSPDPPGSCSSGGAGNNLSLGGSKDNQRGRGKSISPPRGRTRTRHKLPPAPPPLLSSSNIKSSSVKKNKSAISSEVNIMTSSGKDNMQDCWLAEEDDEILLRGGGGIDDSSMTLTSTLESTSISTSANGTVSAKAVQSRRSILRCNVNPYDLISIESNQETTSLVNVSKNKSKNKQTSTSLSLHNITTSSSTSSSSSTSTSSQSTATTAAAAGASPSSSSLATNKSRISAVSQNEFMPPNDDDFNVEDAALNEDDPPPFITSNQKNHNSAAPSKKRQQQQLHRESHSTANRLMNAAVVGGAKTNKNKNQNHQNTVSARRTPAPKRPTTSANSNNIQQQGRATATATVTATKQKTFASNNANSSFETGSNNNRKTSTNKIGSAANDTKKSNYCNVQAIAGQRIILGKQSSSKKSLIKQSGDGTAYESIIINSSSEEEEEEEEDVNANMNVNVDVMMMTMTAKLNQTNDEQQDGSSTMTMKVDRDSENINKNHHQSLPKRPPRYKKLDMADAIADADVAAAAPQPKHSTTMMSNAVVNDEVSTMAAEVTVLSVAPVQNIKSILKRPLSKPSNNKSDDLSIDTDGVTARTSIDNRESPLALMSSSTAMTTDLGNGVGGGGAVAGFGGMKPALSSSINQTSAASQTISTSQFYIPLPQSRKKVQFMMEDNIIYHKVDDSPRNNAKNHNLSRIKAGNNDDGNAEQSATGSSKFLGSNYEYYSKKHQNHHQKQQQQAQQELSTVSYKVTHENLANNIQQYNGSQRNSNEKDREESNGNNDTSTSASAALQASVLREIQQESDLVSRGLNGNDTKVCNIDGDGNGNKTSTMSYDIDHDEKSGLGIVDMNGDFDDVVVLVGGACIANSTVNANVDFTDENYEDVITSEAATQQQTKQGGRKEKVTADSNSKQDHLIMSQQNLRLKDIRAASTTTKRFPSTSKSSSDGNLSPLQLSSSPERAVPSQSLSLSLSLSPSPSPSTFTFTSASASPTAAITTTMPSTESIRSTTSSVMLMASTVLSPLQFKVENNSRNAAGATTGDRCNNEISFYEIQPEDSDYDDIACKKLQALVESDNTVRVTQSRNPIRRSHSERMPPVYNKLTSASCGIENTNNIAGGSTKDQHNGSHEKQHHSTNSNGSNGSGSINGGNGNGSNVSNATNNGTSIFSLNFKDTTALRMKNHNHKDSRDLFSQNNSSTPVRASFSSTIRPKVPPPPPPSSALTPLLSSPPSPLQLLNSTIASANIYTGGDSVSSVEKVGEKATTNILPVTAIEAATAAKTTTMTEQRTATATSTTRKTKTKTPDATTSKCKENFLSLSPSAQAPHSTDNDDSEKRKRKQTFAPPTISISTTAETPVVKDAVTKKDFEKSKTNEKEEVKAEAATSGRRLDSKKQQKQQQSLHQCTEALRTNVRNQRNPVDKSVISRKGNGTSSTDATNVTKIPALESTMESNAIVVDKIDRKLIFEDKPQQPLPVSPKTTICTHDSETNVNGGNSSGITTTTTTTTTRAAEKVEKNISGSPQQMVVRVAPFNKKSSEVHRLKISHTDDIESYGLTASENQQQQQQQQSFFNSGGSTTNTNDDNDFSYTQKKTSILINGDDCYSTMNLGLDASTPIYQSSVVVADYSVSPIFREANKGQDALFTYEGLKVTTTSNMVTINLSSPRSAEEELIQQFNNVNRLRTRRQAQSDAATCSISSGRAIIPINGTTMSYEGLHRSASSTSSASTSSAVSTNSGSLNATTISASVCDAGPLTSTSKRGRTLIKLDYGEEFSADVTSSPTLTASTCDKQEAASNSTPPSPPSEESNEHSELMSHEAELLKILRNPVEAVKRNLVPHVCGRNDGKTTDGPENARNKKMKDNGVHAPIDDSSSFKNIDTEEKATSSGGEISDSLTTQLRRKEFGRKNAERNSFIAKLLEDSTLGQVADGLETETVAELIESSLKRLKNSRNCAAAIDITGSKADNDDINRLISISLRKLQEERHASHATSSMISSSSSSGGGSTSTAAVIVPAAKDEDRQSNRGSISSANSFASANNYEMFEFDTNESDCYQSCSSEITTPSDDEIASAEIRSKFYQLVVDATLAEIELCTTVEEEEGEESIEEAEEHHYESIRHTTAAADPIYEEITDVPPPLPLTAPPINDVNDLEKKSARSIFEGASKYDILSYLVDAKERGLVREESFEYPINFSNPVIIEEDANDTLSDLGKRKLKKNIRSRFSSTLSDSSEDNQSTLSSLSPPPPATATAPALAPASFICGSTDLLSRKSASSSNEIERNDSGVGSETSKSSRSKYQSPPTSGINGALIPKNSPIHLCEDCDGPVETQVTNDGGVMFAPLVCRKCGKKRIERKEIITEIVETEEKYGRDLQIILEEFYHPMLVAGLLTQEQLSAIFLNTEELLENNQTLAEKMRDALDIAIEQGDDDLLTVNIGRIFLDFTQMLHAFESYCVRQAGASLLLANLEKDKELLRIFLKVSQMENAVLRRMNLNSFLMVPVQRVTKYPLLLARLYKVTPAHLEGRDLLKQAQEKIELHLNHINQEAKDVPTKLWRRISSSSPNRRASCEIDMINIKLRKMAIDILEWNHDEVRFVMEGKLLYTQPTDSNWKKARSIKLTPVNALLVTNGKPSANYKAEKMSDKLNFPKHTGIREASFLLVKEKCGRYTLIREPLYLDRCVVCSEADLDDYFEIQEISSKDTFIFKAEDGVRTKQWYTQLQYHAQGMGAWRKRRNALANIMINGMLART